MYLHSMTNLRALSIVLIVFSHTYWISGWQATTFYMQLYKSIIAGGTFYFLFISGYLFNHLSVKKFIYRSFLKQKFKNIVSPYLFISIFPIIVALIMHTPYSEYFFTQDGQGLWLEYIKPAVFYILSGRVLTGYWYIPFIILVFLVSPIFVRYSKSSYKTQLIILTITFLIAGFTHRAIDNMNPFQAFVNFIPMFIFGVFCSKHDKKIKELFSSYAILLITISVCISSYQILILNIHGNLSKAMFFYNGFDLKQLEKMIQVLGVYLLFDKYSKKDYKFISLLASTSFAIYFLHPIVIFVIKRIASSDWIGFIYWNLLSLFVIAVCILGALIVKKILGHKSRYVIGW